MIDTSAYMLRISQASPVGLVVINLEIILEYLNAAKLSTKSSKLLEEFKGCIQKAKDGIDQLIQALDFEIPISQEFYDIYSYSYKLLCDVHHTSDTEAACAAVAEVAEHMEELLKGWREAEEKADAGEPPDAAPKVYTGLTYGRDGQAEEYIDENKDRGYMA